MKEIVPTTISICSIYFKSASFALVTNRKKKHEQTSKQSTKNQNSGKRHTDTHKCKHHEIYLPSSVQEIANITIHIYLYTNLLYIPQIYTNTTFNIQTLGCTTIRLTVGTNFIFLKYFSYFSVLSRSCAN